MGISPLHLSPLFLLFFSQISKNRLSLPLLCPMSSNIYHPTLDPLLPPSIIHPPSSSHDASTSTPSTDGNIPTSVPIYQLNPPITNSLWAPYSPGYGPQQSHANPAQLGDYPPMGGGAVGPVITGLVAGNHAMQRHIASIEQRFVEFT